MLTLLDDDTHLSDSVTVTTRLLYVQTLFFYRVFTK